MLRFEVDGGSIDRMALRALLSLSRSEVVWLALYNEELSGDDPDAHRTVVSTVEEAVRLLFGGPVAGSRLGFAWAQLPELAGGCLAIPDCTLAAALEADIPGGGMRWLPRSATWPTRPDVMWAPPVEVWAAWAASAPPTVETMTIRGVLVSPAQIAEEFIEAWGSDRTQPWTEEAVGALLDNSEVDGWQNEEFAAEVTHAVFDAILAHVAQF